MYLWKDFDKTWIFNIMDHYNFHFKCYIDERYALNDWYDNGFILSDMNGLEH